jgi:hypothetical protein
VIWVQVPRYCSLYVESVFAVNVTTQDVLDSDALEVIGWFYKGVKIRLERHGDGDGRGRGEEELCDDMCGNEAGSVLVELIAQGSLERLLDNSLVTLMEVAKIRLLQASDSGSRHRDLGPCENEDPIRLRGHPWPHCHM